VQAASGEAVAARRSIPRLGERLSGDFCEFAGRPRRRKIVSRSSKETHEERYTRERLQESVDKSAVFARFLSLSLSLSLSRFA